MADSLPPPAATTSLRVKAGWTAIFLGGLGAHKFLLGYKRAGSIMLIIGVLGWIPFLLPSLVIALIGLIEGILYLRKTDAEFEATYVRGRREWF